MSYAIEYSKRAFYAVDQYGEKVFFTFVEVCSNNVSPRIPKPMYFHHGREYEIIGQACKVGASVESGCWKPKGRWCSPENYVKKWRQVIKESKPFDDFSEKYPLARLRIAVINEALDAYMERRPNVADKNNPKGYRYDRILKLIIDTESKETRFYDQLLNEFVIPIIKYQDVEKAIELRNLLIEEKLLYWLNLDL